MSKPIRHGDVDLIPAKLPKGAKRIYVGNKFTVAFGEATGHHHDVISKSKKGLEVWEKGGMKFLVVKGDAKITHQEHKTKPISKGVRAIKTETQDNPFSQIRERVID